MLGGDWNIDAILAAHGFVSLGLTPSPVDMIGQVPPLEEQGLAIARGPVEERRDDKAFDLLVERTRLVREGKWRIPVDVLRREAQSTMIMPHQIGYLGGRYEGDWTLRWCQAWGPFVWRSGEDSAQPKPPKIVVPILGPCEVMLSGGTNGGRATILDKQSGLTMDPELIPEGEGGQVFCLTVPASCGYREIEIMALTPGVCFFGIRTREPQPVRTDVSFDHTWLPPVA